MPESSKYKKILILGQPFNDITGGGITLSNLFQGWPKDKISVAANGHFLYNVTTDVCNTYYQLGEEEHKWIFPFNFFQRSFSSGLLKVEEKSAIIEPQFISSRRFLFVNHMFYPLLSWLGLIFIVSKIKLSERLRNWLNEYKPEVLYIQVWNRETILFATELCTYLQIPSVIHFMDDWPETVSQRGIFKKYWEKRIDHELKFLLHKMDIHLSISEPMSKEYEKRYNYDFVPFHNPIDLNIWGKSIKSDYSIETDNIVMLYSGRIGIGIASSLMEVAAALDKINEEDPVDLQLRIQTPTEEVKILDALSNFKCVKISPLVEYRQLPKVLSNADILLLANDFEGTGVEYLKLSMPTKASEYMITGTPILVYAPKDSAVLQLFSNYDCGYCIDNQSQSQIIKGVRFIVNDEQYRRKISQNSINLARRIFDNKIVKERFQSLILNLN